MAVTTAAANNRGIQFEKDVTREMVRGNMLKPYMGSGPNSVIRVWDMKGKTGGDQINIPLVSALKAAGVGNGLLSGAEEAIQNSSCRYWLDWTRNAVKESVAELKKMSFDIYDYAGPLLSEWAATQQRDEIIRALASLPIEAAPNGYSGAVGRRINGRLWSEASAAEMNTWMTANADRILFGIANTGTNGNRVAGNFAASLANIDQTNDIASTTMLDKLKAMGKKPQVGNPKISSLMMDDGYEGGVVFVGTNGFYALKSDPKIVAMNKDARPREGRFKDNPLFNDGDLLYDKMIIREVPEIDTLTSFVGAGAAGISVAPIFYCGKMALNMVMGQLPKETYLEDTDYQHYDGRGITMAYGVGKTWFKLANGNLVDWGVATGFHASVDPT